MGDWWQSAPGKITAPPPLRWESGGKSVTIFLSGKHGICILQVTLNVSYGTCMLLRKIKEFDITLTFYFSKGLVHMEYLNVSLRKNNLLKCGKFHGFRSCFHLRDDMPHIKQYLIKPNENLFQSIVNFKNLKKLKRIFLQVKIKVQLTHQTILSLICHKLFIDNF